jgi:uncharacterized membrane protein YphA (DoxX/SURF4 family)
MSTEPEGAELENGGSASPAPAPARLALTAPAPAMPPAWSAATRFAFRFAFAYLVLYIFPFPLNYVPYSTPVLEPYSNFVDALVERVGRLVFHVAIAVQPNGSGDTTYNYVQLVCWLALALLAALLWTVLDRRRREYRRLHEWLRVYVRFSLATTMISYGASKVLKSQFPNPGLDRLLQPFGDASPMGLLWTLMGASKLYNVFSGAAEVLGGLLLTLRRTTLLGALVSAAVMTNVVMLNFSYDVPVKLYSLHLLAMCLFLAAPDARRLADLFLWNRPAPAARIVPLFGRRWLHRGTLGLRTVAIAAYVAWALHFSYQAMKAYGDLAPKPALYGIWNVDEIAVDGKLRPPLLSDETRWRRVVFSSVRSASVQLMDDSRQRFAMKLDTARRTVELSDRNDPKKVDRLAYSQPARDRLLLDGTLQGHAIHAALHRVDPRSFLLVSRGFHWINEYPFNR